MAFIDFRVRDMPGGGVCRRAFAAAEVSRALLAACVAGVALGGATADPPPVSAFTDPPRFDHASLSPGGRWFARSHFDGHEGKVIVMTYPDGAVEIDLALRLGRRVTGMYWKSDAALLLEVARPHKAALRGCGASDWGGDAHEVWHFDAKTGQSRLMSGGRIADLNGGDPVSLLVEGCRGVYRIDTRARWNGYRLSLSVGPARIPPPDAGYQALARFPARFLALDGYVADARGRVVLNVTTNEDFERQVSRRVDGAWQRVPPRHEVDWLPLRAGPEPDTWYALETTGTGTLGLVLGAETNRGTLLAADPNVDVSRVLFAEGTPYAVEFEPDYPATRYLEPAHPLARQHAQLARLFPGSRATITSWTADYRRALAVVEGDRMPGDLVLVNAESGYVERLMDRRPELTAAVLAPMTPVAFVARDGGTVRGYVTGEAARRPGATVVLVHDGPHGVRDVWGFDAVAQLLASRGYQVLQVNFRGSSGYGRSHARRGLGEWGGLMQDDLADAARWAVDSGIADPARICLMGSGYGAYAALMGVVRSPGTYRCAVAIGGVYDLAKAARGRDYDFRQPGLLQTRARVGSAGLDALSPARRAADIDVPVLLAHGTADGRSPPSQRAGCARRWAARERPSCGCPWPERDTMSRTPTGGATCTCVYWDS